MRRAARLLRGGDLVEHLRVVAREHRAAVDDHVDLVGPELHGAAHVRELHVERRLPARERRGDARHLHGRAGERLLRDRARGSDTRTPRRRARCDGSLVERRERLAAHLPDLAGRVLPLERRQVHHPDRELEPGDLRRLLQRPLAERRRPLLDRDLVDRRGRRIEERIRRRPRARPVAGQRRTRELTRATLAEGMSLLPLLGRVEPYGLRRRSPRPWRACGGDGRPRPASSGA